MSIIVSIAKDGQVLKQSGNASQKDHAAFLQPAIQLLMRDTGIALKDIDAVAVTGGPGSYTGLRVGMASAKGFCYALQKPLIVLNTLEVLALSAIFTKTDDRYLLCPMIDARRMEVFTAVYDTALNPIVQPLALILDQSAFREQLEGNPVLFFGSGAPKWKEICTQTNAFFETVPIIPGAMARYANQRFGEKQFADLAYQEPIYLKDFQTVIKK
jgi:tRNA threonylcarbamoyladenosine biosynthesis protein TsaB